jgi:hypothetical protein
LRQVAAPLGPLGEAEVGNVGLPLGIEQVQADLKAATEQGCSVEPGGGTVTGRDGRARPAHPPPPPAPPRHPYSDQLFRWLGMVIGEMHVIKTEHGGIARMLRQHDKWDWGQVERALLPILEDLEESVAEFRKEVDGEVGRRKAKG